MLWYSIDAKRKRDAKEAVPMNRKINTGTPKANQKTNWKRDSHENPRQQRRVTRTGSDANVQGRKHLMCWNSLPKQDTTGGCREQTARSLFFCFSGKDRGGSANPVSFFGKETDLNRDLSAPNPEVRYRWRDVIYACGVWYIPSECDMFCCAKRFGRALPAPIITPPAARQIGI